MYAFLFSARHKKFIGRDKQRLPRRVAVPGISGGGAAGLFLAFDKIVFSMAGLRIVSATIEFSAALLMLYFNRVETAFKINCTLALVGPTVLLTTTSLGLAGLAGRVSFSTMAIILTGVALIIIGVNRI